MTKDLLDINGVAELLGIKPASVARMRTRGDLPEPDVMLGRSPGWREATIRGWQERRPGRIGRPRITSPVLKGIDVRPEPRRQEISGFDAFGNEERYLIEWRPERVGSDEAAENIGKTWLMWAEDDCPVGLRPDGTGGLRFFAPARRAAHTTEIVLTPHRVESADELEEGCWRVVEDD